MQFDVALAITILGFSILSAIFYIFNSVRTIRYPKMEKSLPGNASLATIVIPVYREDPDIFRRTLSRAAGQGSRVIVVGDGVIEPYRSIAEEFGCEFIGLPEHKGKRECLARGIESVDTRFVMFLDSDTLLPEGGVRDLVGTFTEEIGGVGANLSVSIDGSSISYSSEFIERSREIVLKAMSLNGSVMLLDGPCAVYRTSVIKPFVLSDTFRNFSFLGKKNSHGMGDDRQLTGHIIRSNLRAVKNFKVTVSVEPKKDVRSFIKQQVRWARTSWLYFFKDLFDGTAKKAGLAYTFELLYIYILPLLLLVLGLTQLYFLFHHNFLYWVSESLTSPIGLTLFVMMSALRNLHILYIKLIAAIVNGVGSVVFMSTVASTIIQKRIQVIAYGVISLALLFVVYLYSLATLWKQ